MNLPLKRNQLLPSVLALLLTIVAGVLFFPGVAPADPTGPVQQLDGRRGHGSIEINGSGPSSTTGAGTNASPFVNHYTVATVGGSGTENFLASFDAGGTDLKDSPFQQDAAGLGELFIPLTMWLENGGGLDGWGFGALASGLTSTQLWLQPTDAGAVGDVLAVDIITGGAGNQILNLRWDTPSGGPPSGPAGGSLSGTYPNPSIAAGAVTGTELNGSIVIPSGATGTTAAPGDNDTSLATTAFVTTADNLKANLASPTLTGNPLSVTPSAGDNDTSIATTAFVTTVGGRFLGSTYLTSGTTFTTNALTTRIVVELVGGGGGGGGVKGAVASAGGAGGGGGGGYARKQFTVTGSTGYTYAIGALGAGGSGTTPSNGSAGGNTTFTVGATTVTASGGSGGIAVTAGTTVILTLGGAGSALSNNADIQGAGSPGAIGFNISATAATGGAGGTSTWGGGGNSKQTTGTGNAGVGVGAGGSGACSLTNTNQTGGAGTAGIIVVYEFS